MFSSILKGVISFVTSCMLLQMMNLFQEGQLLQERKCSQRSNFFPLTFNAPVTTAADDIHKHFFTVFSEKIRLDVSSESSAGQRINMKNQALFSSKDKSKKLKCRLLQFLLGTLRIKNSAPMGRETKMKMAELLPLDVYPFNFFYDLRHNFSLPVN